MESSTILVVEDNDRLRRFMASSLRKAGYEALEAGSAEQAHARLKDSCLDLVLLDLRLGTSDGMGVLRTIRRQDEDLPVMIVSSMDDQDTKLGGFDVGCDDYITKPFYIEELLGRVRRLLKRARPRSGRAIVERLTSGPFEFDIASMSVAKDGRPLQMRRKLFDLLLFFARHPDQVLSNEALYDRAWDSRGEISDNSIYVHIRQLRALIEEDPSSPRYIRTVRNAGYVYSVGDPGPSAASLSAEDSRT
ncbi:MAG: response regulator transcription factor [Spirochaetes bacterium]|nr:response regulator transcription factor [Spirochaetota bacterium]MBU1081550.1 response regulator transcription factor [Spirochaetota bacterium]